VNAPEKLDILNRTSDLFSNEYLMKYSLSLHYKRKREKSAGTRSHSKILGTPPLRVPPHCTPAWDCLTLGVQRGRESLWNVDFVQTLAFVLR